MQNRCYETELLDPFEWGKIGATSPSPEAAFLQINDRLQALFGANAAFIADYFPVGPRSHGKQPGLKLPERSGNSGFSRYKNGYSISEAYEAFLSENDNSRKDPTPLHSIGRNKPSFVWEGCEFFNGFKPEELAFTKNYFEHGLSVGIANFDVDRADGSLHAILISSKLSPQEAVRFEWAFSTKLKLAHLHFSEAMRMRSVLETTKKPLLSTRERDCLAWLAAGLSTQQIADQLTLADSTVNEYIASAKRKLGATTRAQACARATLHALIFPG